MERKYWIPIGYIVATYVMQFLLGYVVSNVTDHLSVTMGGGHLFNIAGSILTNLFQIIIPIALLKILLVEFKIYKELKFYYVVTIVYHIFMAIFVSLYYIVEGLFEVRFLIIGGQLLYYMIFLASFFVLLFHQGNSRGLRNTVLIRLIISILTPIQVVFNSVLFGYFINLFEDYNIGITLFGFINMALTSISIFLIAGILYFIIRDEEKEQTVEVDFELEQAVW